MSISVLRRSTRSSQAQRRIRTLRSIDVIRKIPTTAIVPRHERSPAGYCPRYQCLAQSCTGPWWTDYGESRRHCGCVAHLSMMRFLRYCTRCQTDRSSSGGSSTHVWLPARDDDRGADQPHNSHHFRPLPPHVGGAALLRGSGSRRQDSSNCCWNCARRRHRHCPVDLCGLSVRLNIKAAFIHNISGALASVSVIVAGKLILLCDLTIADPLATVVISGYIPIGASPSLSARPRSSWRAFRKTLISTMWSMS